MWPRCRRATSWWRGASSSPPTTNPTSAIASGSGGQIYLSTTRDAALNSGWDVVPDVQATTMTSSAADGNGHRRGDPHPVMEEELTATVREQEAGAVRIRKDVIAEERRLTCR